MSGWLGARVATGIGIVAGLLGVVLVAWWTRGIDEATRLFGLLQGVVLATLGWLYGSQGLERAERIAVEEATARRETDREVLTTGEERAALVRELALAREALSRLAADPATGRKVQEVRREVSERDDERR